MLIVHEVMGRNCGWLTAATARVYRDMLENDDFLPELGLSRDNLDVHGVYIPRWRSTFPPKPPASSRSWTSSTT
jgi:pyrophosphate--fructose-6-phosphate 1-phosphotransferase